MVPPRTYYISFVLFLGLMIFMATSHTDTVESSPPDEGTSVPLRASLPTQHANLWSCSPRATPSPLTPPNFGMEATVDGVFDQRSEWPYCPALANDFDKGFTLEHFLGRLMCGGGIVRRKLRVMQIGANTGDNSNDHLVRTLKLGVAEAVLLEPVPWIFALLSKTYRGFPGVNLINAAMTHTDLTNISFFAPKNGTVGWESQMGGLRISAKTSRYLAKRKKAHVFEHIQVRGIAFSSLLTQTPWNRVTGLSTLPDLIVVDTEGFDAEIIAMILAAMHKQNGFVPIIQYEWKHLEATRQRQVLSSLIDAGYFVVRAHYDIIAVHRKQIALLGWPKDCGSSFAFKPRA